MQQMWPAYFDYFQPLQKRQNKSIKYIKRKKN